MRTQKSSLLTYSSFKAIRKLIFNRNSFLRKNGWLLSMSNSAPYDEIGNYLPWMNYGIIHLLKQRLNNQLELFEFGCGYSSLFYAKRVKSITSVEHNEKWYNTVRTMLPCNANVIYQSEDQDGKYARKITGMNKKYDIVIIDGIDRVNCVKQSIHHLQPSGVILLDDSDRAEYKEAFDYASEHGFRSLDFLGIKPTGYKEYTSSIFYRDKNCLGI